MKVPLNELRVSSAPPNAKGHKPQHNLVILRWLKSHKETEGNQLSAWSRARGFKAQASNYNDARDNNGQYLATMQEFEWYDLYHQLLKYGVHRGISDRGGNALVVHGDVTSVEEKESQRRVTFAEGAAKEGLGHKPTLEHQGMCGCSHTPIACETAHVYTRMRPHTCKHKTPMRLKVIRMEKVTTNSRCHMVHA